jgi:hypothetical protein
LIINIILEKNLGASDPSDRSDRTDLPDRTRRLFKTQKRRAGNKRAAVLKVPFRRFPTPAIRIRFQGSFRPGNGTLSVTLPQRFSAISKAHMDWVVAVNEIVVVGRILPFTAAPPW